MGYGGRGDFSFCFSSIFGCFNNYIDIRQINKKKTHLILYVLQPHKNMRLREVTKAGNF